MPTRITDAVHLIQIPSVFPVGATNSYLINAGQPSLIDAGLKSRKAYETLVSELGSLDLALRDIEKIIVTHAHVDHFGMIRKIQESSSCDVYVHNEDYQHVSDYEGAYLRRMDYFRDIMVSSGTPQRVLDDLQSAYLFLKDVGGSPLNCRRINEGDTMELGDIRLQVVHVPGHTIGQVALSWRERGILFCGDHLLKDITPNVGVTLREAPHLSLLPDYLRSLERTAKLEGGLALPGHHGTIPKFQSRALEIIEHHRERKRLMLSTVQSGEKSAFEISRKVFGRISLSEVPLAIAETMSHMKVLEQEGSVVSRVRNAVTYYDGT